MQRPVDQARLTASRSAVEKGSGFLRSLEFITNLGDAAVTLPLLATTIAYLFWRHWPRAAVLLGAYGAACALSLALLKVLFSSCFAASLMPSLHSPSGHTAMSAMTYCAIAGLTAKRLRHDRAMLAWGAALLLVGTIAVSRTTLLAHSPLEVMVGLVVGLSYTALFTRAVGPPPPSFLDAGWLLALAAAVLIITLGAHFQIESMLQEVAAGLRCN